MNEARKERAARFGIEPEAATTIPEALYHKSVFKSEVTHSIAISLKRIADAMTTTNA